MLRVRLVTILALTVLAPLGAQASSISTPKGFLTIEGNATFALSTNRRFQIVDATHLRTVIVMRSFALRRDGLAGGGGSGTTLDALLKVGTSRSMNHLYGEPDKNFLGQATTVFNKTNVSFPNWSIKPTTPPAPWTGTQGQAFTLPFSQIYPYLGQNPFIWDLTLKNGTSTGTCDRAYQSPSGFSSGTKIGSSGCGNFAQSTLAINAGSGAKNFGMSIGFRANNAPANGTVLLSLDIKDSNLTVPGWCSKVHAFPTIIVPFGAATATGLVNLQSFAVPHTKSLEGVPVYSQMASANIAGIVLSDARRTALPMQSSTAGHDAAYIWYSTKTASASNYVFYGGCLLARLSTK
ncbi:MAG: hypothetical protein ACYTF5_18190 [Planctomycetota bacterium]|jgi:hypothetical protein